MKRTALTKDFTALVPMGGRFEGQIALHSTRQKTLTAAIAWAKARFAFTKPVAIISDDEYPDLYPADIKYSGEDDPRLKERWIFIKELYDSLPKYEKSRV